MLDADIILWCLRRRKNGQEKTLKYSTRRGRIAMRIVICAQHIQVSIHNHTYIHIILLLYTRAAYFALFTVMSPTVE